MSDKPPVIRLTGITKRFSGVVANKDVSLEVYAGEVHGLLGENGAGKTTLMNIVTGLVAPDAGTVEFKGQSVTLRNPLQAKRLGIAMVHQHFMLVPTMTVAENVAMGLEAGRLPLSRLRRVSAGVRQVSERYGLIVDPAARIEDLSVGERQRVEIIRLLFRGADLLIFDEPTGVLTPQEWRDLAVIIGRLAEEGKAIIFITHKLDELLAVADRCTVMRDGEVIGTTDVAHTDKTTLARMMVGREVVLRVEWPYVEIGGEVLVVRGLTFVDEDGRTRLDDIDFEVRRGEILGIAGVDGNGQRELIAVLSGLLAPTQGEIWFDEHRVARLYPPDFIRIGGAVVHADRRESGIALDLPVQDNLIMSEFAEPPFSRNGWLRFGAIRRYARRLLKEYDVRAPGPHVLLRQLSGGNQQKVVLARELSRHPKLLIAGQPTRGLDIGAVEFVYAQLLAHKKHGGATLLVSTELEEILSLSDRIGVIAGGRLLRVLDRAEATLDLLGLLMAGERRAPA